MYKKAIISVGLAFVVLALIPTSNTSAASEFYVSPSGSASGSGSITSPWDLATAFSGGSGKIKPGDTVWLRGGTYSGIYLVTVSGNSSAPITFRQYPEERVTVDGAVTPAASTITVNGNYISLWGFEVTNTDTNRFADRGTLVNILTVGVKLINMVIHDGGIGIGTWSTVSPADQEVYGNLIYNSGWEASGRGYAHSIYVQNANGIKRFVDNILFNSHSFGIHAYAEGGKIDNIQMEGNTSFNHGILSGNGPKANFLAWPGNNSMQGLLVKDNMGYYSPFSSVGRNFDISSDRCTSGEALGNYFAGGTAIQNFSCPFVNIHDNTLIGRVNGIGVSTSNNTIRSTAPTGVKIFVRPNKYETGRANITIYNWDKLPSVNVDLSNTGLKTGDLFQIKDVQNFYGNPVTTGTYNGSPVSIPMTNSTLALPIGNVAVTPDHTSLEFGAFILLPSTTIISLPPPPPPAIPVATASFIRTDTTTKGSWKGVYGSSGYQTALDATSLPSYAQVGFTNKSDHVWNPSTTDVRALQKANSSLRQAATWFSASFLYIPVDFTDSLDHQVALYAIDWDNTTRSQTIQVIDTATSTVLDSQVVTNFNGGKYFIWNVKGDVTFKIINNNDLLNAVISGIFFDPTSGAVAPPPPAPAPAPIPPSTKFISGQRVETTANLNVRATASILGTLSGTQPNGALGTIIGGGTNADGYYWWNVNYDSGADGYSVEIFLQIYVASPPPPPPAPAPPPVPTPAPTPTASAQASFVTSDTTTKGNWRGVYGDDGYHIANDTAKLPSYANLSFSNALNYTWTTNTSEIRALQGGVSGRIASTWHNTAAFSLNLNLTDNQTHRITLYLLDWDSTTRAEIIEVIDTITGIILDTRQVSSMNGGKYLVYDVKGSVKFRVTKTNGANGVVQAIFFGGSSTSLATPTPSPTSPQATFLKVDATTKGDWKGVYGNQGYQLANEGASLPTYAELTFSNKSDYTWSSSTTLTQALQKATSANRVASCWYSGDYFGINLNLTDNQIHQVALYSLDWDSNTRAQTISVLDSSGAILNTQSVSSFKDGKYLVWNVQGEVTFRINKTSGANAVISGVFIDPAGTVAGVSARDLVAGTSFTKEVTPVLIYAAIVLAIILLVKLVLSF